MRFEPRGWGVRSALASKPDFQRASRRGAAMANVAQRPTSGKAVWCDKTSHVDGQCRTPLQRSAMKDERLTLRLDAELKAALAARATQEERTMSKVAERILREALLPKAKRAR